MQFSAFENEPNRFGKPRHGCDRQDQVKNKRWSRRKTFFNFPDFSYSQAQQRMIKSSTL
jgi:hypothetical protein